MPPSLSILGASVRSAAQSALRAGFIPCGADLFADHDLQRTSAATIRVSDYPQQLIDASKQLPSGPWMYTGGLENHPKITFTSKTVTSAGDANFRVTGDLTMMGVTKEVVVEVSGSPKPITDPWGGQRLGGTATAVINRTDYGLKYNSVLDSGGVTIGEEVKITIDLELVPLA